MTDTSREAVERLLQDVTPGPWDTRYDDYGEEIWFGGEGCGTWTAGPCFIGGDGHDPDLARTMAANACFIAWCRDGVPALLARAEAAEAKVEKLKSAVLAAAKIGQIVGFLGSDEARIEAFREACGPELWSKARAALAEIEGENHE